MNRKTITKKSQQLESELSIALQKLEQLDTCEVAIKECTKLFAEYNHPELIKTIVARIHQTFRVKQATNLLKENTIVLVGVFANSFKEKALTHFPVLLKCVMRNFDIERESLQQSCARSITELYQNVLRLETLERKDQLLYSPMLDYLITVQGICQSSCCLSLYELLLYMITNDEFDDFHHLADRVLTVINKIKVESEEAAALRTLIIENCHEDLLANHKHLDRHEFCTLVTTLESYSDNTKLESQIKSELIISLDAFLSRPMLRQRIDESSLAYLKKVVEKNSFSKLPRVRTAARTLHNKLKHPDLFDQREKRPSFWDGPSDKAESKILPRVVSAGNPRDLVPRNERVYINPSSKHEGMQSAPVFKDYASRPISAIGHNDQMSVGFTVDNQLNPTMAVPAQRQNALPPIPASLAAQVAVGVQNQPMANQGYPSWMNPLPAVVPISQQIDPIKQMPDHVPNQGIAQPAEQQLPLSLSSSVFQQIPQVPVGEGSQAVSDNLMKNPLQMPSIPIVVTVQPYPTPSQETSPVNEQVGSQVAQPPLQNSSSVASQGRPPLPLLSVQQPQDQLEPVVPLISSPQLQQKRDAMKMLKTQESHQPELNQYHTTYHGYKPEPGYVHHTMSQSHSESPDQLKRGLYLIEPPLLSMTKGKGWGSNVRAKNYLKKHTHFTPGGGMGDGDRVREMREARNKHRSEMKVLLDKSRDKKPSTNKFKGIDESAEKSRKRRLLMIKHGINPDDPDAEEKLKEKLARKNELFQDDNPFAKRSPENNHRYQK